MDNNAIEILAVNAVKNSIVMSDYLTPFIADNDKEPSWDGNIYIYNDKSKKKSSLKGRIPVQVKGKESDNHSTDKITYTVKVADLKNYLNDGGVIYFVVYLKNDGSNKIYYADLLPVKIQSILSQITKKQKDKSLEFKEFPTDGVHKARIFMNFYIHKSKQASFKNAELLSLFELAEQEVLEELSVSIAGYKFNKNDPQKSLFDNDLYMYAKVKGSSIVQPIQMLPKDICTKEKIDKQVFINGKLFYNSFYYVRYNNKDTYQFGESFTLENYSEDEGKVNYKSADFLRVRMKDLEFLLNALEFKRIEIGDTIIPLLIEGDNFMVNIEQQKISLEYYKKMQQVLDMLNVKEDLNISGMKKEDERYFDYLIHAFIDKKSVELDLHLPPMAKINISNISLALSFVSCKETGAGAYRIYDFFSYKYKNVVYYDENENPQPISQYHFLKKEDFLKLSNTRFSQLLPSYQSLKDKNCQIYERANEMHLTLLSVYDECNRRDVLDTAKSFIEWIIANNQETCDIHNLNLLQTIKRERKFNNKEMDSLCKIIENNIKRYDILVGAYLLLDNQDLAKSYYNRLSSVEQENFKKYPIYKFWNN